MKTIVIDTNILISALIKDGKTRKLLTDFKANFVFPEFGLDEIYHYKPEIVRKARISERDFDIILLRLLKYIRLAPFDIENRFKPQPLGCGSCFATSCFLSPKIAQTTHFSVW